MGKAMEALVYQSRLQTDGSTTVRDGQGRLILTAPNPQAAGLVLGWMRLAAWAHAELHKDPTKLYEVLQVNPAASADDMLAEASNIVRGEA
jgi:hypothetical protein